MQQAEQLKTFISNREKQQVETHLIAILLWKFYSFVPFEEKPRTSSSCAHRCVLQFKNSNGVIGMVLLRQQPDDEACVCEGHLKLLCGRPVLCTLFLLKTTVRTKNNYDNTNSYCNCLPQHHHFLSKVLKCTHWSLFNDSVEHDNSFGTLFPNHQPEMATGIP